MNTNDNLIETILDDIRNTSVTVEQEDTGCPYTHPENYTFIFSIATELQYRDVKVTDTDYIPSEDEIRKMLSIFEAARNAGIIRSYSKVYKCWTDSNFYFYTSKDRLTMDAYSEYGKDEYIKAGQPAEIQRNDFWKIKVGFKIDKVSVYLPLVLAMAGDELKSISKIVTSYDAYMFDESMMSMSLREITNVLPRTGFMDNEWPAPIYSKFLPLMCTNYVKLYRLFTKDDIFEMKHKTIDRLIRNFNVDFQSRVFKAMELYMDSPIRRWIGTEETLAMLNNMSTKNDEKWASKKFFLRMLEAKRENDSDKLPKCFYSRENISQQTLESSKTYLYDFAKHVNIDEFIYDNSMQKVVKAHFFAFSDNIAYGVLLWHGLTEKPITTLSIGVIFNKKTLDDACRALKYIYKDFNEDLFKSNF